jgi:putative hemolysin
MDAGPTSSTPSFEEKTSSKGFLSMFFGDKRRQEVSEDEIRTMVADNEELDDEEKRMIHEVMDLGDATAEEVMTPRVDMIMVGSDETVRQAIDRMRGTGYSRLPVFRDDDDDIIGIVRYKDLIDPLLEDKEDDLAADYVAEVGFVPESKSLLPLLNEMQTNRQQMVIVVDEYGGTAGLITIEDIVEEIVGEIVDETDFEDADIKALGAGSWCVKGSCPTDDAAEAGFPVKVSDDYETVAGWLMDEFDCVPQLGDEFAKDGFTFKVRKVRRRRISELLVTKIEQA